MREGHGPDTRLTPGECVQKRQMERTPNLKIYHLYVFR